MEERILRRYSAIGLTIGLFAILISFGVNWVLGFGFPSPLLIIAHGVLGVNCLIASVLLFRRSQEWSLVLFWFGMANFLVVSTAVLSYLFLALGGDIFVFGIWLTYAVMFIIFAPAYFLAKKVWKTPHEGEIE